MLALFHSIVNHLMLINFCDQTLSLMMHSDCNVHRHLFPVVVWKIYDYSWFNLPSIGKTSSSRKVVTFPSPSPSWMKIGIHIRRHQGWTHSLPPSQNSFGLIDETKDNYYASTTLWCTAIDTGPNGDGGIMLFPFRELLKCFGECFFQDSFKIL